MSLMESDQFYNKESLSELVISLSKMKHNIIELGRDAVKYHLKMLLGENLILNDSPMGINYIIVDDDLILVLDMNFQPLFFSLDEWHKGYLAKHIELADLTDVINEEAQKVLEYKPVDADNQRCILLDTTICNFVLEYPVDTDINIIDCKDKEIIILGSYTPIKWITWKQGNSKSNKVYIYNKKLTKIEKEYDNWCTTAPNSLPWVLVNSSRHIWGKLSVTLESYTTKPIAFEIVDKITFDSNDAEDFERYLHSRAVFKG